MNRNLIKNDKKKVYKYCCFKKEIYNIARTIKENVCMIPRQLLAQLFCWLESYVRPMLD